MSAKLKLDNPKFYTNRELSWLAFNDRVLEEARDANNPLFERVSFLAITQSNLDEFFNVRVASLRKMVSVKYNEPDAAGMTPKEQLKAISKQAHAMVAKQYRTLTRSLLPSLRHRHILLHGVDELTVAQHDFLADYFRQEVFPILTPLAVDASRPFPFLSDGSMNMAIRLTRPDADGKHHTEFATVQVPHGVPRVIHLPGGDEFVLLEDVIRAFIDDLFIGATIKETAMFRVTRDMGLDVDEADASDLIKEVQSQLKKRERGRVMRLEVDAGMSKRLVRYLTKQMRIDDDDVYAINGPIDLTFLKQIIKRVHATPDVVYPEHTPYLNPVLQHQNIFDVIRQQDVFVHLPYDSFAPVTEFIHQAAVDPQVLAVKMTLYRVSSQSPIIKYLKQAANNGKQVTVLVELKARFDEENNVHWARELEEAGCHVIYGLVGLKTHCKLTLIVRRDEDGIRRYMHMATGNYNDVTARLYTDMGLFTCNTEIGVDASSIFNMLSGFSEPPFFHKLAISPDGIKDFLSDQIDAEIAEAQAGRKAIIWMKMNSLSNPHMIRKLYAASAAGVQVHLLVRGICDLKVGIPGVSTNITVHSIVGRFLEHSRVYYFYAAGAEHVYLSSADLMTRNLKRRVEILFPILQDNIRVHLLQIFDLMWSDTVKTRVLQPDDTWQRVDGRGRPGLDVQAYFVEHAEQMSQELLPVPAPRAAVTNDGQGMRFTPLQSPDDRKTGRTGSRA
ncbi:RNA degradosome polyphosphate kinase [Lacticaseibacillus thailandensis]|uniref:Polyphosphate kinase n=1 Tax=Lacticaseibacillus thailandensis DSM 22698 = JCM 13996 TaxID=1423810 RepID=A0A0R2C9D7_9LACO|nr:polyphosphate kinase [Lacticaseibacillus thailandensis DSM 22698 = JCM 13996]